MSCLLKENCERLVLEQTILNMIRENLHHSTIHTIQTDQNVIQMPNLESCKVCGQSWGGELKTHRPQHFVCTSCGEELQEIEVDNQESWLYGVMNRLVFEESVQRVVVEETILRMGSQNASKKNMNRGIVKFLPRRSRKWLIDRRGDPENV